MIDSQDARDTDFRIPLPIRVGLIGVHVVVASFAFLGGLGLEQLISFSTYIVKHIVLLPLVFVAIGLVGKLLDRSFRLENAFYLGLLMSLVLAAQAM